MHSAFCISCVSTLNPNLHLCLDAALGADGQHMAGAFAEDGIKEGDKILPVQPQESPVQGTFTQDEEDEPF